MSIESPRFDRGLSLLHQISGSVQPPVDALSRLVPDLVHQCVAFGYGDVLSRPGLDLKTRQMITVAALGALGNAVPQLVFHVKGACTVGCEPLDILELAYLLAVFAGFPSALNFVSSCQQAFAESGGDLNPPLTFLRADAQRREEGLASLRAISGESGLQVLESLRETMPALADFILEFSYGDVLSRPVLDARLKELCIVGMLTAMGNATAQLRVHIFAALQVGCVREEIQESILQMAVYAGFPAALNAMAIASEVFRSV